jgi:hypothetical protein
MSRKARMIAAGCALAVTCSLAAGTPASAGWHHNGAGDRELGTDGTRVTGVDGPDSREGVPSGIEY